jgi:hypothetical protein
MSGARIEITTREGWRRDLPLQRSIVYVGSHPGATIYLPGAEIAPRHLQWVPSSAAALGYRVVNLGPTPVRVLSRSGQERTLAPRAALELMDGETIEIGGYRLAYHGGALVSSKIEARLELAGNRLDLEKPLQGVLYIRNAGQAPGVQFMVELQGFSERLLRMGSGPILYPGVERGVAFSLSHPRSSTPPAGQQTLTFVVSAPLGYPGESVTASEMILVAPFFDHRVRVLPLQPGLSDYTLTRNRS